MKIKRKRTRNIPLSHSNLSAHENLRSRFDPNGSYTGVPEKHGYPDVPDGESRFRTLTTYDNCALRSVTSSSARVERRVL